MSCFTIFVILLCVFLLHNCIRGCLNENSDKIIDDLITLLLNAEGDVLFGAKDLDEKQASVNRSPLSTFVS